MSAPIDLSKVLDKAWEDKPLPDILNAPVSALEGVSAKDGQHLEQAFNIKTIADLAAFRPFHSAIALATLGRNTQ
jgi:hypothetical protein